LGSGKRKWSIKHNTIIPNIISHNLKWLFHVTAHQNSEHNNHSWIFYNFISFFITSKWLTK
jgi:hypothetical protein